MVSLVVFVMLCSVNFKIEWSLQVRSMVRGNKKAPCVLEKQKQKTMECCIFGVRNKSGTLEKQETNRNGKKNISPATKAESKVNFK